MEEIIQLNSENITSVLYDRDKPLGQLVIIYFFASWCQPCKNVQPIYEQAFCHFINHKIQFATVDIAQSPTIAPQYAIKTVPTIAIFKDSRLIQTLVGELTLSHLLTTITYNLSQEI